MVSEYDVIPKSNTDEIPEGYEEISAQEFLDREGATTEEVTRFCNTYNAVNIHFLICNQTYNMAYEIMADKLTDPRLEKLNAIVLLSLKPKGRASKSDYTRLSQEKFTALVDFALCNKIGIGFDSCGCGKFVDAIKNSPDAEKYMQMAEPCESGLFSSYFNTEGKFFPCSFAEGSEGWEDGIDIIHSDTDLWNSPRVLEWRKKLLGCKRSCPMYNI